MDGDVLTPGSEPDKTLAQDDRQRFAKMPAKEKLLMIKNMFLLYPRLAKVRRTLRDCRYTLCSDDDEPPGMLITGPSGCGKTYLIKQEVKESPPRTTECGREVKIVLAKVSSPATIPGICSKILDKQGDPFAERGTTANMTLRIQRNLIRNKTELLCLDEFQHFIDRDSQKVLRTVSDWLKNLIDECTVPIVLLGMENCYDIFDEKNEQLNGRFSMREPIEPFRWDTPGDQLEYRRVLDLADRALPFVEPANIADPDIAAVFFGVSRGRLRPTMKVLKRAARNVVRRGGDRIAIPDLAEAYEQVLWSPHKSTVNPFSGRKLLAFRHSGETTTMKGVGNRLKPSKDEPRPFQR